MTPKMPRGAIPTPRSELAASEAYRVEGNPETFVPSGEFPSPNHELAAARPYRAAVTAPESFVTWPQGIDDWGERVGGGSLWAEEAFAKACAEPRVFIPAGVVLAAARECGSANFSEFMQAHGFCQDRQAYLDGPFRSVVWTNEAALHGAIANVGPVKIGIASANLASGQSHITPGINGWAIHGIPPSLAEDHCASLCGYGLLEALVDLFARHGVSVNLPAGMPAGLCYAMFTRGSIGIIDRQSLMSITGEAWVRDPTTVVNHVNG